MLFYLPVPLMVGQYEFSVWQAIMEIVVSSFRLSDTPIQEITDNNPGVFFIMYKNYHH